MKDGPLEIPVVTHKDGYLAHHLEVITFSANFGIPSVSGPFLRDDEELGHPRELLAFFEFGIVHFSCITFQVQDNVPIPWGLIIPLMLLTSVFPPISRGLCFVYSLK